MFPIAHCAVASAVLRSVQPKPICPHHRRSKAAGPSLPAVPVPGTAPFAVFSLTLEVLTLFSAGCLRRKRNKLLQRLPLLLQQPTKRTERRRNLPLFYVLREELPAGQEGTTA